MNLLLSLRSELFKTTRTGPVYLTIIAAAVGPAIFLFNVMVDEGEMNTPGNGVLNALFKMLSEMNGVALFPLFTIFICTLLPQIEYRNHALKQVFASPQTRGNVFLAKLINLHLFMLVFLVATHVFMLFTAIGINLTKPALHLFEQPLDGNAVFVNAVNAYILLLAVGTIQFWLGLRSRNFIIPVGIGVALWLTGTIFAVQYQSDLLYFFPYSFHATPVSAKLKPQLTQVAWTSLAYAVLITIVGFIDFRRRAALK
jgi:hypothetical protein